MEIKAGGRLRSTASTVEVIVVQSAPGDLELRCAGAPMVGFDEPAIPPGAAGGDDEPILLGKRYVLDELGLELLCTKAGAGPLEVGAAQLHVKDAKPLPASD